MKRAQLTTVRRCSSSKRKQLRKLIWERDSIADWICCYWCSKKLSRSEFTVEHIQPLAMGGRYEMKNLAAACSACNGEYGQLIAAIVEKKRAHTSYFEIPLP